MTPIQPDQAEFLLRGAYLPDLLNEHGLTKKVISAIPADKSGYRPDEVSKTALELAWHTTVTELRFLDAVVDGEFNFTPRPKPESILSPTDLIAWYEEQFNSRVDKLKGLSSAELMKIVDFRGMFQLPAVMYLNFVLHHGGEGAVDLRGELRCGGGSQGRHAELTGEGIKAAGYAIAGRLRPKPVAVSNPWAICNTLKSCLLRPTI